MTTVTFIGGGSAKFISGLVRDMFTFDALKDSEIRLMDIDPVRLDRSKRFVDKIIQDLGIPATVKTFDDQRTSLDGTDYVIVTIMVGGFRHYKSDGEIPLKYGVLGTATDTIGPGSVMRLVRTAPVYEEIVNNLKEVAPNAVILNYSNPMAMNTWSIFEYGHSHTVGLCHSIQGSYQQIAGWLGIDPKKVTYTAAGINHLNCYLTLEAEGKSLYPELLAKKDEILKENPDVLVKFELLEYLGYWPAEGQHHQTEYYPWFRKDQKIAEEHYSVETMWGYKFDKRINSELDEIVENQISGKESFKYDRGMESGAYIIDSIETGEQRIIYGNVKNTGLIDNLPSEAVVEVPCLCNMNEITPQACGKIPRPLAQTMGAHVHMHGMAIEGVMEKSKTKLRQAVQMDPMTAMKLTLPEIDSMMQELFEENKDYMTGYR